MLFARPRQRTRCQDTEGGAPSWRGVLVSSGPETLRGLQPCWKASTKRHLPEVGRRGTVLSLPFRAERAPRRPHCYQLPPAPRPPNPGWFHTSHCHSPPEASRKSDGITGGDFGRPEGRALWMGSAPFVGGRPHRAPPPVHVRAKQEGPAADRVGPSPEGGHAGTATEKATETPRPPELCDRRFCRA